jgi:ubiquitin C-terminal hydrolase
VLVHLGGTMTAGHYTCYVRPGACGDVWWYFDDGRVRQATWEEVKRAQACVALPR